MCAVGIGAGSAAISRARVDPPVDGVVSYHMNPYASGAVGVNVMLAKHLGVPFLGLRDAASAALKRPLLSFKVGEMAEPDQARLSDMPDELGWRYHVFLHDWSDLPLEHKLVRGATGVWCGNHEIRKRLEGLNPRIETVWTPGLLTDCRTYPPVEISLFTFGMAHKIQTGMFRRLRSLLERSGRSYVLFVSSATHETKSIEDAQSLYDEMNEIFPGNLFFMGQLSDVAVFNQLRATTFFTSFFPNGVRANNTSVAGAMDHGAIVITNLDEHSPPEFVHMENVIDIERCEELPSDPLVLKRISVAAMETARVRGWDSLAARINGNVRRERAEA